MSVLPNRKPTDDDTAGGIASDEIVNPITCSHVHLRWTRQTFKMEDTDNLTIALTSCVCATCGTRMKFKHAEPEADDYQIELALVPEGSTGEVIDLGRLN